MFEQHLFSGYSDGMEAVLGNSGVSSTSLDFSRARTKQHVANTSANGPHVYRSGGLLEAKFSIEAKYNKMVIVHKPRWRKMGEY
mmetsp:Transcript_21040/g.39319  ORF Transcript_21040/g.39319 Transcript_21040/m.39319 type:complete len:84 (-) Transcript_21040:321-572(-)